MIPRYFTKKIYLLILTQLFVFMRLFILIIICNYIFYFKFLFDMFFLERYVLFGLFFNFGILYDKKRK